MNNLIYSTDIKMDQYKNRFRGSCYLIESKSGSHCIISANTPDNGEGITIKENGTLEYNRDLNVIVQLVEGDDDFANFLFSTTALDAGDAGTVLDQGAIRKISEGAENDDTKREGIQYLIALSGEMVATPGIYDAYNVDFISEISLISDVNNNNNNEGYSKVIEGNTLQLGRPSVNKWFLIDEDSNYLFDSADAATRKRIEYDTFAAVPKDDEITVYIEDGTTYTIQVDSVDYKVKTDDGNGNYTVLFGTYRLYIGDNKIITEEEKVYNVYEDKTEIMHKYRQTGSGGHASITELNKIKMETANEVSKEQARGFKIERMMRPLDKFADAYMTVFASVPTKNTIPDTLQKDNADNVFQAMTDLSGITLADK